MQNESDRSLLNLSRVFTSPNYLGELLFDTTADLQGMDQIKKCTYSSVHSNQQQENSELEFRDSRWDWVCILGKFTYPRTPNGYSSPA